MMPDTGCAVQHQTVTENLKESDPPSLQRALLLLFSSGQPRHFMPYWASGFILPRGKTLGEFNGTDGIGQQ